MIDKAVKFLDSRTDDWEIHSASGKSISAIIEKGRIKNISGGVEEVVSVRVIVDGRVGFASSNSIDGIMEVSENALRLSRISEEYLDELPAGGYTQVDGIYDKRVENVDPFWLRDIVDRLINSCSDRVNPAHGTVDVGKKRVKVVNSAGVDLESTGTACTAYLEAVVEESSGFEMVQSRTLDMDVEFVGRRASELALGSLGGEKIGKVMCDAVLSPVALSQLLFFTLYPAFSAENVAKGRSMLAGRIGEDFGEFSLLDDGTLKGGLATSPFDDEGNPTLKTIIFEKGVLRSFITDFRFSKILQIKTTGNGFKDEATSYPHTSPSNIIFDFEDKSRSIEEDALVVNSFIGAHTSNPISGDFSLECQNSFFRGKPVKSAMIYGNIYELLKKIQAFGKDVRQVDNTVTPSVRFNDVSVSG
jgi:PmbA protein